jgi:hypothetical protein
MLLLLAPLSLALAQDSWSEGAASYQPTSEPTPELPGRTDSSSSSGSGSSSSGSDISDFVGKSFAKGKIGKWTYQPYVAPGGGVQIGTSGDTTSIVAGVDVGVKYWRKRWTGDLYVGGSYATGDSLNGYELHLGDQMGRREKYWGLEGGLEVIYSGYTYANGSNAMKPSIGAGVPIDLTVGPSKYYLFVGATPMYFAEQSRGLEGEWHVGAAARLDWLTGSIGFTQYRSAAGVQNTPTLTIGVGS